MLSLSANAGKAAACLWCALMIIMREPISQPAKRSDEWTRSKTFFMLCSLSVVISIRCIPSVKGHFSQQLSPLPSVAGSQIENKFTAAGTICPPVDIFMGGNVANFPFSVSYPLNTTRAKRKVMLVLTHSLWVRLPFLYYRHFLCLFELLQQQQQQLNLSFCLSKFMNTFSVSVRMQRHGQLYVFKKENTTTDNEHTESQKASQRAARCATNARR